MGPIVQLFDKSVYEAQMAAELPPDQVLDLFGKA
jgi:hypothetical protein